MATLKEIVDKYGYGCEVGWRSSNNTVYYDIVEKSPLKNFSYRLTGVGCNSSYTDFHENSGFDVWYVKGGNKIMSKELDRNDLDTVDDLCSKVMGQLKEAVLKDVNDYVENDFPELVNQLLSDKGKIRINDEVCSLAEISQALLNLVTLIDDYTYVPQEIKK